jgi:hypothetical protein
MIPSNYTIVPRGLVIAAVTQNPHAARVFARSAPEACAGDHDLNTPPQPACTSGVRGRPPGSTVVNVGQEPQDMSASLAHLELGLDAMHVAYVMQCMGRGYANRMMGMQGASPCSDSVLLPRRCHRPPRFDGSSSSPPRKRKSAWPGSGSLFAASTHISQTALVPRMLNLHELGGLQPTSIS